MKKLLFSTLLWVTLVPAQELTTSLFEHFPLFSKLIETDAVNLGAIKTYNIGIVYTSDEDESVSNANNLASLLKNELEKLSKITEIEFNFFNMPYTNKGMLYIEADNNKVNTLYICEMINEDEIRKIKSIADRLGMLTFTGAEDLYEEGLSITVTKDGDTPTLIINKSLIAKERPNFNPDKFSTFATLND